MMTLIKPNNFIADKFILKHPVNGDIKLFGVFSIQPVEETIGLAKFRHQFYRLQLTEQTVEEYQIANQQQIELYGVEYQIVNNLTAENSAMRNFLLKKSSNICQPQN